MIGAHRAANALLTKLLGPQVGVYNGVAARDRDVLARDHEPDYKQALVTAVRDAVAPGDDVVFVGGGRAVAPVHAARCGADVTVYEAGDEALSVTKSAAELNDVELHTIYMTVGTAGAVTGRVAGYSVDPADLEGDVLVLDCEGAERDILPVDGFDTVIVETHPAHGSPLAAVRNRLPDSAAVVGEDPIDGEVVVACPSAPTARFAASSVGGSCDSRPPGRSSR